MMTPYLLPSLQTQIVSNGKAFNSVKALLIGGKINASKETFTAEIVGVCSKFFVYEVPAESILLGQLIECFNDKDSSHNASEIATGTVTSWKNVTQIGVFSFEIQSKCIPFRAFQINSNSTII